MNIVTLCVLFYIVLQLVLAFLVSRRIQNEDDYLLAGRSLGYGLSTFTIFATWFGAETCLGAAGVTYRHGMAGNAADPFGYTLCLVLMGTVFAVPLWKRKLTTLADLFRRRYGASAERMAVLLMVPTSVMWAAAQIRAFGQVLAASSTASVDLTVTIAALVVIIYTTSGGMWADAVTDLLQGIVLIIGLVILSAAMLMAVQSTQIAAIPADQLSLLAPGDSLFSVLEKWTIPIIGSVVAQELAARVLAARSPQVARTSVFLAAGLYLLVGLMPVGLGLLGTQLLPGVEHPEQILIIEAQHYLPTWLYVVFAGALVSAILSTVDSALLVSASLVAHNIFVSLRPEMAEARKIMLNRAGVVVFGVLAWVLALFAEGVYELVEQASALGSSGIFITMVFGLFTSFGGIRSALAALVTGFAVYVVGSLFFSVAYPYITSLAAALSIYVVVGWGERALSLRQS